LGGKDDQDGEEMKVGRLSVCNGGAVNEPEVGDEAQEAEGRKKLKVEVGSGGETHGPVGSEIVRDGAELGEIGQICSGTSAQDGGDFEGFQGNSPADAVREKHGAGRDVGGEKQAVRDQAGSDQDEGETDGQNSRLKMEGLFAQKLKDQEGDEGKKQSESGQGGAGGRPGGGI